MINKINFRILFLDLSINKKTQCENLSEIKQFRNNGENIIEALGFKTFKFDDNCNVNNTNQLNENK